MLSILLPVNRHTVYFTQVINSLTKAIENLDVPTQLVVVTNKLTDEEVQLVKQDISKYPFENVIQESPANNLAEVLNFGLEICKYDFVARMDADDVCLPNRFGDQLKYLGANSDVAAVGGQLSLIDSNNRVIGRASYPTSKNRIKKRITRINCLAHPAVMFRKRCIYSVGGYQNDFPMAEDYFLWVRLSKTWSLANLSECVLQYRIHQSQITSKNFMLQLCSTVRIIALSYPVNQNNIRLELDQFLEKTRSRSVMEILSLNSIRPHSHFKASIAILILRRDGLKSGIKKRHILLLLATAFRGDPTTTLIELFQYALRIFQRFYGRKTLLTLSSIE